jgi:hypothetical protein
VDRNRQRRQFRYAESYGGYAAQNGLDSRRSGGIHRAHEKRWRRCGDAPNVWRAIRLDGVGGSGSVAMIEITSDSSDFCTACIPDSVFAVPAGHHKGN